MTYYLIEQQINDLITNGGKVKNLPPLFYAIAPQNQKSPFMVFTLVSEIKADALCGQNATTSTIQLDSYALDPFSAKNAALSAFDELKSLAPATVNASGSFEEETNLFRYQVEFSVIY